MTVKTRPGSWCDVYRAPDGYWLTWTQGALVSWQTFRLDGTVGPDAQQTAPEPLMFCRTAVHEGQVFSIHQGHDTGKAWLVSASAVTDLGLTFGVQPVAIDSRFAYVVRSGHSYDRIDLATGAVESFQHGVPGSSQGIRDVVAGHPEWSDDHMIETDAGIALHEPSVVGMGASMVVVGQADPPQIAGVHGGTERFTAIPGEAYEPHIATDGATYAVCARTPGGAAIVILPPFPAFVSAPPAPAPAPAPAPVPVPVPPTEPKPMPIRTVPMPARIPEIVQALYARNVALAEGSDDDRRALQTLIAEQARFELGAKYGAKKADSGRPRSKDAIAFLDGDVLYSADCFNGSTRKPSVPDVFTEIPGQVFDPVPAINHLGDVTQPGTPTHSPAPASPGAAIDEAIRALKAECEALRARLAAVEARPSGGGTVSLAGLRVALKTDNGHYLTADEGGGKAPFNRESVGGGWEIFTVEPQ